MIKKTGGALAICMIAVSVLQCAIADDATTAARDPYQTCRDSTTCTCEPVLNVHPPQMPSYDHRNLTSWLSNTASGLSEAKENIAELTTDVSNLRGSVDEIKANRPNPGAGNHGSHVESDFVNYYDEIAQAICTAMNTANGWTFAVRRDCGAGTRTCAMICADPQLRAQDSQVASIPMTCFKALHLYPNRPRLANGSPGNEKLGLKTLRYECSQTSCGPNYCCCRS